MCTVRQSNYALPATTQSQHILGNEQQFMRSVQQRNYKSVIGCLGPEEGRRNYYAYTGCVEDKQRPNVDVNVCFEDLGTALHVAVQKCDVEMVRVLMLNGADPTLLNEDGVSAQQIAKRLCDTKNVGKGMILEIMSSCDKGHDYHAHMRAGKIVMMRFQFNHTYCESCNKWRSRSDLKYHNGPECVGTCGTFF